MKKGIILSLVAGGFFALASCGAKYTPLTEEQMTAQADSTVNAQKDAKMAEWKAACDASMEAQVNAKVETMKSAETAAQ